MKLLLLEKDIREAKHLQKILDGAGDSAFEVEWLADLSAGLARLAQGGFDALLFDLDLLNGTSLDELVKGSPVPVIVLTDREDETLINKLLHSGAQDYLIKGEKSGNLLKRSVHYVVERKRIENALRESQACFYLAIKNSPITVFSQDTNLRYTWVYNPLHLFSSEAVLGKTDQELLPSETASFLTEVKRQILQTGEGARWEVAIAFKEGSYIFDINLQPLLDAGGKAVGIIGTSTDTTDRIDAEQQAYEAQRRFREVLENVNLVTVTLDTHGNITFCNDFLLELAGWQRDEVAGKNWFEIFIPADSRAAVGSIFEAGISAGELPRHYDNAILTRSGELRTISWNNTLLRDRQGNIIGTTSIGEDITDRLQAQTELAKTLKQLKEMEATVNKTPAIVFRSRATEGWPVEYVSANIEQLGYTPEDFLSGRVSFKDYLILPEDLPRFSEELLHFTRAGFPEFNQEYRVLTKQGEVRWVDDHTWVRRDDSGVTTHFQGLIFDITERKQMEEALRDSELYLSNILDSVSTGVVLIDAATHVIVDANLAALQLFGAGREALLGEVCHKFICPANKGKCPISDLHQQVDNTERLLIKANGETLPVLKSVVPITHHGRSYLLESFVDITERKQIEAALKKSEEEKAVILDSMTELVAYQDTEHRILWANKAAAESLGLSPDQLVGRYCYEIWHQRGIPCEICPVNEAKLSKKPAEREISSPDGRFWFIRGYPVLDENGDVKALVEVTLETTEIRKVQEALRQSERLYRNLVENIKLGVTLIDKDYNIVLTNASQASRFGKTPEEMVGRKCYEAFRRGAQLCENCPGERAMRSAQREELEDERFVNGPNHYHVRLQTFPLLGKDGKPDGFIEIAEDISERRRMEQIMRESERRFREILETVNLIAITLDVQGNVTFCNNYLLELTGWLANEVIGQNWFEKFLPPEQCSHIKEDVFDRITEGLIPAHFENEILTRFGSHRMISWNNTLLRDAKGNTVGLTSIGEDITERKQAQELAFAQRDLALSLSATSDLDEALNKCIDTAIVMSGMDCGAVFLLDDKNSTHLVAHKGLSDSFVKSATLYDGDSPEDRFVMAGKPVYGRHLQPDGVEAGMATKEGLRAIAAIPISAEGKIIGSLNIGSHVLDKVPVATRAALESFASQIASAIFRIRAETAKKHSEHRYRLLAESLKDVIVTLSLDGLVTYCSPAIKELGGYDAEKEIGKHISKYFYSQEELAQALEKIGKMAEDRKAAVFEFQFKRKDDEPIPVEVTGKPLVSGNRVVAVQCVIRDVSERKRSEEEVRQSFEKLRIALAETVNALAATVEKRDPYTAGHQVRVSRLACAIARKMDLPEHRIDGIRVAATIHDIGKVCTPIEILNKPGHLSGFEISIIRDHPKVAYEILKNIPFPWPVAQIAYQHHERVNGSGYPLQLRGDEILLESRIVAVADVMEAMTSHRPFRPALALKAAKQEILNNKGVLYDPQVVDACLRLLSRKSLRSILEDKI